MIVSTGIFARWPMTVTNRRAAHRTYANTLRLPLPARRFIRRDVTVRMTITAVQNRKVGLAQLGLS